MLSGHQLGAHLTFENETFKGPHLPQKCNHNRSSWANITWQWGRFYKINNQLCTLLTAVMFTDWNTAIHTHTHTQETLHINTVQGRERREAETVKFLKAQFKEAGPSL